MDEVESVDEISSKTWHVMENKMITAGLREGITAGREQVFQPSFDEGYRDGYEMGYEKGYLRGFLSVMNTVKLEENKRKGMILQPPPPCKLCVDDTHDEKLMTEMRENHQRYVHSLKETHSALIKNLVVDVTVQDLDGVKNNS